MKRRTIKKWYKVYSNPIAKNAYYAESCYERLKQWFPYLVCSEPWFVIVDWENVEKYLGINEKEI